MKNLIQFLISAIVAASVAFLFANDNKNTSSDIDLKILVSELELSNEIAALDSKVRKLQFQVMGLVYDRACFNLSDPGGFHRIDTDLGIPLFLSVKHVERYMDGYKIQLDIGNPNSVAIHDVKLNIDWWLESYFAEYDKYKLEGVDYEILKESKSKTQRLLTTIQPRKWNAVDIIIPSASEQDAKSVRFMIEDAPIVSLG